MERLSCTQWRALGILYETDDLVDPVNEGITTRTLQSLERRKLAVNYGEGLWRISLKGMIRYRNPLPPPESRHYGRTLEKGRMRGRTRRRIFEHLRKHPGSTSKDIRAVIGLERAASELLELTKRGLVRREPNTRGGMNYRYYLEESL